MSTLRGGSGALNRDVVLREMYSKRENNLRKNSQHYLPELSVDSDQLEKTSSSPRSITPITNPKPRLFALLIGINNYDSSEFLPLRGAEPDTLLFRDYLVDTIKVPESQIVVLLNKDATRSGIIEAFKTMANNKLIVKGDPMLIFYAGHGGEVSAKDSEGEYKIQMLVPVDYSMEKGKEVYGIPDLAIGALIDKIAEERGDNITVIFDCCNSASGTRGHSDTRTRSVELPATAYNPEIDKDLFYTGTRGTRPTPRFKHAGLKSHMLLAACGESEEAKETRNRGNFSTALLKLLLSVSPEKLRYSDVLLQMDAISGQNPQCEGFHRHRVLFNAKVLPPFSDCYKIEFRRLDKQSLSAQLVLDAGSAQGITIGTEFAIYKDTSMNKALDTVTVQSLTAFYSIVKHSLGLSITEPCIAVQTKAGQKEDFRLYIPRNDKFLDIYKKILDSTLSTRYQLYHITLVSTEALSTAHLQASMGNNDEVVFELRDYRATQYGFNMNFEPVPTSDLDYVAWVLNRIAHYYRELNRSNSDQDITGKVELRFYKLDPRNDEHGWRTFQPEGPNLCQNGVVDFVIADGAPYGLKLVNNSSYDLYPYVFYFDNSSLAIDSYYETPASARYTNDVPLKKMGGVLSLGHGSAGVTPFSYELKDDQTIDVGFIKIFLCTNAIDLSKIPQLSPFETTRASKTWSEKAEEKWDTLLIPAVQRRYASK